MEYTMRSRFLYTYDMSNYITLPIRGMLASLGHLYTSHFETAKFHVTARISTLLDGFIFGHLFRNN
jgi:hypothetical protein